MSGRGPNHFKVNLRGSRSQASAATILSRYIAEQTNDGFELIDRLLGMARLESPSIEGKKLQKAAIDCLLDRLAGKPAQTIEASIGALPDSRMHELEPLTDEELEILAKVDRALALPP